MEPKLQALIFDPEELAPESREELSLSGYVEGIEVADKGLDLGDQQVKQFMAEGLFGSKPIDRIWPLIDVKIPLRIKPTASLTFDQVRSRLAAKAAQINEAGAVLKRVLPSGKVVYADVVEAHLHLSESWSAENRDRDLEALLELQRLPEWYEEIVEGDLHALTGDGSFTEIIKGDLPARVESLTVTDTSGNDQRGLLWHFRGQHYSSDPTAAWAYDAETLELLDLAEKVASPLSPPFETDVVKHPNLSTEWTPILGTTLGGSEFLTHVGVYDVWARIYTSSETPPWLRLVWDVGDMVSPAENIQVQVPAAGGWYLVNLGQINVAELPFGLQRWKGVVMGKGEDGGENVYIHRLWFLCGDESSGVLRASLEASALPSIKASDSLKGEGALAGSSANRGGDWEESGDAGDFKRTSAGAERTTTEDVDGRTAILSESALGACTINAEVATPDRRPVDLTQGIYLRYIDSTHWIRVAVTSGEAGLDLRVDYKEGINTGGAVFGSIPEFGTIAISAALTDDGLVSTTFQGTPFGPSISMPVSFWKGFANGEGKVGIFDQNASTIAVARYCRAFIAAPLPPSDAVIYADKNARLSGQGIYRQSQDGASYGTVAYPGADLPRLPVSGPGESPVEIAVKPTRGDAQTLPDSGRDGFTAQIEYRPCWAEIPGA